MPKPKRLVGRIKQKNQKASTSSSKPPPPPSPPWVELPREITADILLRLGAIEILQNAQRVCSTWWNVCHDPIMWRDIDMGNDSTVDIDDNDLDWMCRVAVNRSQGQLLKINIEHFGNNDLLKYIAERSSQLRHLRLVSCDEISDGGLAAVAKNFPLLEELHIYLAVISEADIVAIGRSCSQLKSFTLNNIRFRGFRNLHFNVNDEALAIAGNMPELRRLALFGNNLTNEGLRAILDGCRRLESLDLRHCYSIDLEGDLGKRCRQQIKDLKCPRDSTSGYEFRAQICDYSSSNDEYPSGVSEAGLSDYLFDYEYDDFDYDDFTNPFSGEYHDEEGFFY
ncbi:F-box protein SKIP19 [Nicotiana tabacum]|uniref:F-box protein SKIP19 n=2 Tax=Nicotiana TaxID=4085 RepID=A0AC58U9V1_TOBAC|nr:PREDICTED: putative F-box/LRR-repeat protein 23 [Nicotiana sylvestris]XP_009800145.1 PREDICTED: putative F-box/LRR-repeat protein 23 [Nicotiana sylvestris]XP_009800147.1 PREDICTED: putative F-box/LRR-repeat protein 23 [Nicotiana sylvestris]